MISGRDDMRAEVEEFFGDRRRDAEASSSVFAVDDKEIDGIIFEDVGQMFADDMAAGGAEDIADKKDIHDKMLALLGCMRSEVCPRLIFVKA
jgi:hypothetical protein